MRFDFTDPSTFAAAFLGVRTMFLIRPPALGRLADLEPALRTAVRAGVQHVVLLSVQGAEKLAVLPHARLERWLRLAGVGWTFLRPSFFDQNLITVHGPAIRRLDELVMPAGGGRTAFVDAVDVAEVAAVVLAEPEAHAGQAYRLTGAEALTYGEVAGILTAVCGRPIRYQQPGLLRYLARARTQLGLPPEMVAATAVVYSTARIGLAAGLTGDTAKLLGREPTSMTEFAQRERAAFASEHHDTTTRAATEDGTASSLSATADRRQPGRVRLRSIKGDGLTEDGPTGDDLRRYLLTRSTIDQAKGILMGHYCCDEDAAFAMLRRWSMTHNTKLWIVAGELLAAAERSDGALNTWLCRRDPER